MRNEYDSFSKLLLFFCILNPTLYVPFNVSCKASTWTRQKLLLKLNQLYSANLVRRNKVGRSTGTDLYKTGSCIQWRKNLDYQHGGFLYLTHTSLICLYNWTTRSCPSQNSKSYSQNMRDPEFYRSMNTEPGTGSVCTLRFVLIPSKYCATFFQQHCNKFFLIFTCRLTLCTPWACKSSPAAITTHIFLPDRRTSSIIPAYRNWFVAIVKFTAITDFMSISILVCNILHALSCFAISDVSHACVEEASTAMKK